MKYVYGKRIKTLRDRLTSSFAALVLLASNSAIAFPLLFAQHASAIVPYSQGFESGTAGWTDGGGYGAIQRVASGTDGITSASGSYHAVVTESGTGPYTYFSGRSSIWTGTWTADADVYLDPSWVTGSGFEYSVAATRQDNSHLRDFVFHVTKDTSTGNLLVAGSNNAASAPREDLETLNHYVVPAAGWYTLRHTFRDQGGALAVDLQLVTVANTVVFTETRTTPADLIASVVGGNRYGWFTDVTLSGGLAIDNVQLNGSPAPVVNINTNEEFTSIKDAVQDSDTVNGHTIEVNGSLTVTDSTVVNKDVTVRGNTGATITTSGTNQLFTITADGASIEGLTFIKTDNASEHIIIGVQADNVTIQDNSFTGQYVAPSGGDVSRAIVVSPGVDNVTITGNSITNFRQPAYLNNQSNGTVSNNFVTGTRGWVVEKASSYTFTGNTWGTNNPVDIAIIPGVDPASTPNNYTCQLAAMKAANNNPTIEDQYPASIASCPNTPPTVTFASPTPAEGSTVNGIITPHVLASDDYGMGSYFIRLWKGAFESGAENLIVNNCWSAPGAFNLGTSQDVTCPAIDTASLEDGTYVLSAQFQDGHIAWGQALRTFVVDKTAPNAPNNLKLQVRSTGNFIGNNGWTNKSDVTALWSSNNSEPVTYEYQYWNDVPSSPYHSGNRWLNPVSGEQYEGTVNQGDGKHYFCVVAIDLAGNRSACSTPFSFNYDSTNPVTDINVSPVVNGIFTVSGDASDNLALNRVYVQLVSRVSNQRCGGTTINLIPDGAAAAWSKTYDITTLMSVSATPVLCPEGEYAAHVAVVDMAGNTSAAGWTDNFLVEAPVEPEPTPPAIVLPVEDYSMNSGMVLNLEAHDEAAASGNVQWAVRRGTCAASTGAVAGNVDGFSDDYTWTGGYFTAILDTTGWAPDNYCFVFNPAGPTRLTRIFNIGAAAAATTDEPSTTGQDNTTGNNANRNTAQNLLDGQVLAATDDLTNTGTQSTGFIVLAAASLMGLALLAIRRKQEN